MAEPTPTVSDITKVALASLVGTTIEYFDFFIAATTAATVWGPLFFPTASAASGLLLAFGVYGVGFASRPIGSFFFGHFGDKIGRRTVLVWTLITTGIGTLGMAVSPSYAAAGVLGGVVLTVFRFIQGLGLGGEWGGASTWVTEFASKSKHRSFWAGWIAAGVPFGLISADAVILTLESIYPHSVFVTTGWRIAFVIGAAVILMGALLRYKLTESPIFRKMIDQSSMARAPASEVLRRYIGRILLLAGSTAIITAGGYTEQAFTIGYLASRGISPAFTTLAVMIGASVGFFALIGGSVLADRVGRRRVIILGASSTLVFAYPFFMLLNTGNHLLIILAMAVATALLWTGFGPFAAFLAEQFPTRYRYSGSGLSYQISTPFAGGLAPIIASSFLVAYGHGAGPYVAAELIAYSLLTIICASLARETKGSDIDVISEQAETPTRE